MITNAAPDEGSDEFAELFAAARGGDGHALSTLLDGLRPYLLAIAHAEMPAELRGKCGASDLVQETIVKGLRGFALFSGGSREELRAWMREILKNNLADWKKQFRRNGKRAVDRERGAPGGRPEVAPDPSPTPGTCAATRERDHALEEAVRRLPDDERAVIWLRSRDHLPWEEVGRRLGRTPEAARKLWSRAVGRLQRALEGGVI